MMFSELEVKVLTDYAKKNTSSFYTSAVFMVRFMGKGQS
jgi:hypothetical protein